MIDWLNQIGWFDWLTRYGIVLLRVLGLFFFVPVLGSEIIPLRLRLCFAAVLALVLFPLAATPPTAALGLADWVRLAASELSVGFALGLAARVLFTSVEAASALVAGQSGFSIASMVDPMSGDPSIIPATFHSLLFIALFLAADLHHVFIAAVLASYDVLPAGTPALGLGDLGQLAGDLGMRLFAVAITLAAPALILSIAVDLVLVLVGKAMPQVPILMVAYPFKMALGLVALALLSASVGNAVGWLGRTLAHDANTLVRVLAGA